MARISWAAAAVRDLEHIRSYIHGFDPAAAVRFHAALRKAAGSLSDFPNRGRPASKGRRELPSVPPYLIRYRVLNNVVVIEAIKHSAQLRD